VGKHRHARLARLRAAAVGLDELAGRAVTLDEAIAAFEETLIALLDLRPEPGRWTAAELAAADRVQRNRFQP
jgi:hypothetical protein